MAESKKFRVWGVGVPPILVGLVILLLVTTSATIVAVLWSWRPERTQLWQTEAASASPVNPVLPEQVSAPGTPVEIGGHRAPHLVNLSHHFNAGLTNAWHFPGGRGSATLRDLPQGVQEFGGVPFDVRGIVQLASARTANLPNYPERSTNMLLGLRCRSLHFLHATGWVVRDGTQIGSYWVHYQDGSASEIPIIYGEHLREWHGRSDRRPEISAGTLAWDDGKPGTKRRLFQCRWENPKPEVEVLTVDFVSAMTDCFPFLIAITVE